MHSRPLEQAGIDHHLIPYSRSRNEKFLFISSFTLGTTLPSVYRSGAVGGFMQSLRASYDFLTSAGSSFPRLKEIVHKSAGEWIGLRPFELPLWCFFGGVVIGVAFLAYSVL